MKMKGWWPREFGMVARCRVDDRDVYCAFDYPSRQVASTCGLFDALETHPVEAVMEAFRGLPFKLLDVLDSKQEAEQAVEANTIERFLLELESGTDLE